jgi:hypothetical protein
MICNQKLVNIKFVDLFWTCNFEILNLVGGSFETAKKIHYYLGVSSQGMFCLLGGR